MLTKKHFAKKLKQGNVARKNGVANFIRQTLMKI